MFVGSKYPKIKYLKFEKIFTGGETNLAQVAEAEADSCLPVVGLHVVTVVDEVGNERREKPIVSAVLEEVDDRHCAVRELVHCLGLVDSLHKTGAPVFIIK